MRLLAPDKVLELGLTQVGFDCSRQKVKRSENLNRFMRFYGCLPIVLARVWGDLQTLGKRSNRLVVTKESDFIHFLLAVYLLKCYPLEAQLAATFKVSERTARDRGWDFVRRIQELKHEKVSNYIVITLSVNVKL